MLTIALLGASPTETSPLARALERSVAASGWPVVIVTQTGSALLPAAAPGYDLVLLTGLETWMASAEATDAAIRAALAEAGMAYHVLYGNSSERLAQTCEAIKNLLPRSERPAQAQASQTSRKPTPWVWLCDKCSDPQCEHRLLTALLAQRTGTGQAGDG